MRPRVEEHLPLRRAGGHDPHRHRHLPDVVVEERHRLPDRVVPERLPDVVPADPREVLRMDAVVGVEVGDQDLGEVEALLVEHAHHPAPAPVHRRRLPDHDARLERVFDVIEAAEPRPELLLQTSDVLPSGLVGLAGDDPDHLQLVRIVGVDDRLDRALEHVVRLGVGRDDRQVDVLQRVGAAFGAVLPAQLEPVRGHVAPHPHERAVHAGHDGDRAQDPVGVEDQHGGGDQQRPARLEDDRDPRRREQHDPGDGARKRLERAGAELAKCLLPGGRRRLLGLGHGHERIIPGE